MMLPSGRQGQGQEAQGEWKRNAGSNWANGSSLPSATRDLTRSRRRRVSMKSLLLLLVAAIALLLLAVLPAVVEAQDDDDDDDDDDKNENGITVEELTIKTIRGKHEDFIDLTDEEHSPRVARHFAGGQAGFYHGVASGSPKSNAMVFWTRYTPREAEDVVELEYRIAAVPSTATDNDREGLLDPSQNGPHIRYGRVVARPQHDWTIKLDVVGLQPKTQYVYAFTDGRVSSPVGVTKTLPDPQDAVTEGLRMALFSCTNFKAGYFHVYDIARRIRNLDVWVHVGDYIYEAASAVSAKKRPTEPRNECRTLQDYRLRYHSYHHDPVLQKLRATAPLIATWDDHEFVDNVYRNGSRKHEEEDGRFGDRIRAAVQAYFEWMPMRPGEEGRMGPFLPDGLSLTQTFEFGKLATLFTCDTRLRKRSAEPASRGDPVYEVPYAFRKFPMGHDLSVYRNATSKPYQRMMANAESILENQFDPKVVLMGGPMVERLTEVFEASKQAGKPWQIFAAPVMMGYNVWPAWDRTFRFAPKSVRGAFRVDMEEYLRTDLTATAGRYRALIPLHLAKVCQAYDDWCGAAHERSEIYKALQFNATTPVVLGGDVHTSWAMALHSRGRRGKRIGVNVGGAAVTSSGEKTVLDRSLAKFIKRNVTSDDREMYQIFHEAWYASNPSMEYAEIIHRGFTAIEFTSTHATYDFFHIPHSTVLQSYKKVPRNAETGLPPFYCGISLRSQAGVPGSLTRQGGWQVDRDDMKSCTTFTFEASDTSLFDIPVPPQFTE